MDMYGWVPLLFQFSSVQLLSRVRPSATPWTAAYQAPPPMGFSRQEYWSRVPSPSLTFLFICFDGGYLSYYKLTYRETHVARAFESLLAHSKQE